MTSPLTNQRHPRCWSRDCKQTWAELWRCWFSFSWFCVVIVRILPK